MASLAAAAALWQCLTACSFIYDYDDCPADTGGIMIVNDWHFAPQADPAGMAYLFLPEGGGPVWRYDFPGRDAGEVTLAPGRYSFISHNDDTSNVIFEGTDSYSTYRITTPPAQLPRNGKGAERTVRAPDAMWGCAYREVMVTNDSLEYLMPGSKTCTASPFVLTALQRRLTPRYSVIFRSVRYIEGVSTLSASLSGLGGALLIAGGEVCDYPVTMPFAAAVSASDEISGTFHTFGIPPSPDVPNVLDLYVRLRDGRLVNYSFDVTTQVRRASDPMDVTIVISGLDIEDSGGAEGAFDVAVDGWVEVYVNITE